MVKRWVRQALEQLTDSRLKLIKKYYLQSWVRSSPELKFRYVKIFAFNATDSTYYWISPARYTNIKRISAMKLEQFVANLVKEDIYPLRIFQSSCEWLNPDRVELPTHHQRYLLNPGIFAIECDTSLGDSIENAQLLSELISDPVKYVFSGNKSIHVWINATLTPWINSADSFSSYEEKVLFARQNYFAFLQQQLPHPIDARTALDTRRILPMINSLNALTGRIVTQIPVDELATLTPDTLLIATTLSGWY